MRYLSRIMLVTQALTRALASGKLLRNNTGTYKEPRANMRHRAILFLKVKFKPFNSDIGSKVMTMSSKMLRPAPANENALKSRHFPARCGIQTTSTGTHWNMSPIRNAIVWQNCHTIQTCTIRRNLGSGKIRRYRRRMENFARFWIMT
jgi:hypothetical protein